MFESLYKSVDLDVQPSLELINKTKQKMKEEINNSNKVVQLNFYKYGALAACLVIFIGVLSVNTSKDIAMNEAPIINETVNDSYQGSIEIDMGNNRFDSPFNSAMSSNSTTGTQVSRNSILDNIVEFFIGITQWFKELLF